MNFSFTSKLKVENKIRKKTCYIYCCIINNAPSEQILAGFLICHLQVSRYIFYSYSPTWLQPSKLSPDKSLEQVYKTHRMTYIRKVRPLLEDALLYFSAHCTFIFHYSFVRLQCFRIGPLKLVPPASFHQVFSSKKV